jgi:oligoendopeptidase F
MKKQEKKVVRVTPVTEAAEALERAIRETAHEDAKRAILDARETLNAVLLEV